MDIEFGNFDNLNEQFPERRGWFVGNFIPDKLLSHSKVCEIKWARHSRGTKKVSGKELDTNTRTAVVLISGKWKTTFPQEHKETILSHEGDYLIYSGAYHENEALEDSCVIVIRWKEI